MATGEKVAVKIAEKKKQYTVDQMRQEYRILNLIRHPNIVGMINYGETEEKIYLILEYCEGKDLLTVILNEQLYKDAIL